MRVLYRAIFSNRAGLQEGYLLVSRFTSAPLTERKRSIGWADYASALPKRKCGALAYVIEFRAGCFDQIREAVLSEVAHMLAEKFFLLLETLRSQARPDGGPIIVSTARHVPIKLPGGNGK
jgi:hypothetical protein